MNFLGYLYYDIPSVQEQVDRIISDARNIRGNAPTSFRGSNNEF